MHSTQQKLLQLVREKNLGALTLREIGSFIGESSPQKVKHHLLQLEKRGLIAIDRAKGSITRTGRPWATSALRNARLLQIPVLGSANAGPARMFADQNIEGYLRVSSSLVPTPRAHRLFALKVDGPSMNRAIIKGQRIEDGDYVIIDNQDQNARDGDVVLSLIEGLANIKKYYVDSENRQILLMSESTEDFPAIHIHEDDDFRINGKVIAVIKKPRR